MSEKERDGYQRRILWLEERRSVLLALLRQAAKEWAYAPREWRQHVAPIMAERYPPP